MANPRIGYVDFFAGPGRYKDGTRSTPVMVVETALQDVELTRMLVTVFNDRDEANVSQLKQELAALPGVDRLGHKPAVHGMEVGPELAQQFRDMQTIPSLFFIDPWGYKGLSLDLVNAVIKDWACECIFFFNYNRINMGLNNKAVKSHMDSLFGQEQADALRTRLSSLNSDEREATIMEELCQALLRGGKRRFVLPYRFRDDRGVRTSHHLVFVTKHFKGYHIMKDVMGKASSTHEQGVPSFEFSPPTGQQDFLAQFQRPVDGLGDELVSRYRGKTMKVWDIYEAHSVGTNFVLANYKEALKKLLQEERVAATKPDGKPIRKNSMPDEAVVEFREGSRS